MLVCIFIKYAPFLNHRKDGYHYYHRCTAIDSSRTMTCPAAM